MEAAVAAAAEAEQLDARGDIVGVHAIGWAPDLEQQREIGGADETPELPDEGSSDDEAQKTLADDDWPWWRYVGHYTTRVAAFIGYAVTFAVVAMFGGALYLLRPRTKRRARMWIDAAGDDPAAPGRRARLRISWAVMHRMWATLKEEWRLAVDDAWRNPNAAAVLRRTGVQRRASSEALLTSVEAAPNTEPKAAAEEDSGADAIENEPSARSSRSSRSSSGGLGLQLPDDSDHSTSLDRLLAGSGAGTPRRNSTGTRPMTPMTPLKLAGAITLTDHVLGYGSHGTIVYRGMFQGRAVAVKRLLLDFYDVADHEVQVLQESDSHPNVIRYFCTERQDHFMYIALELCCGSLADATMRAPKAQLATQLLAHMPKMHVLRQLARGLHHLHALKLVHRDIKPQNILVAPPPHRRRKSRSAADPILGFGDASDYVAGAGAPRVLISDFGLSRILDDDESSFANTFTMHAMPAPHAAAPGAFPLGMIGGFGGGTVGWRAPECFDSPDARFSAAAAAAADSDQPSWPSLRPNAQPPCDEPSPYVSRGT
ncbi:bifunctional endoribonuclease/protein kinase ire1, partial [Kickxella alabastrina]